jgi:hypothetical protein
MATFRNPPRLSANLAIGTLSAIARTLGLARPLARFATRRMVSDRHKARVFAGYEPTAHDVFVTTFTKSGTNWALQIAQQTAHLGDAEFDHIHDVVAWPEAPFAEIAPLRDPTPRLRAPTGLRVIKTAAPVRHVPYSPEARYIAVLRDPKDVFVSSYHFVLGVMGLRDKISVQQWLDISLNITEGSWADHTASVWAWRDRPNVLILFFADMKRDPEAAVRRIVDLMDVSLTDAQLARVVERSSFAYMKQHDAQFGPPQLPFTKGQTPMLRTGKSGQSGELLDRAQQAAIDRHFQAELERLGSDFPYAEHFEVVQAP